MEKSQRQSLHPHLAIFDSPDKNKPDKTVGWFAMPQFFTKEFMRAGNGIPTSFWQFTFIVWRELLQPEPVKDGAGNILRFEHNYRLKTTVEMFEEFGLDTAAIQDWSNAYGVSGLFTMVKGARKVKDQPGTPTTWAYNKRAGFKDWLAFIAALSNVCAPTDGRRIRRSGEVWSAAALALLYKYKAEGMKVGQAKKLVRQEFPGDGWPASDAYKLKLAYAVDQARKHSVGQEPLPPVNAHRIQKWVEQGKAKAHQLDNGVVEWRYVPPKHNWTRGDDEDAE